MPGLAWWHAVAAAVQAGLHAARQPAGPCARALMRGTQQQQPPCPPATHFDGPLPSSESESSEDESLSLVLSLSSLEELEVDSSSVLSSSSSSLLLAAQKREPPCACGQPGAAAGAW